MPSGKSSIETVDRPLRFNAWRQIASALTATTDTQPSDRMNGEIGTIARARSEALPRAVKQVAAKNDGRIATGAVVATCGVDYIRRKTIVLFVPPNPNAFDNAARMVMGRADSGT